MFRVANETSTFGLVIGIFFSFFLKIFRRKQTRKIVFVDAKNH